MEKALYGLKQAPFVWNSLFDSTMVNLGFEPLEIDPCVYKSTNSECYLAVYVDDGIVIANDKEQCQQLIRDLNCHFKTKTTTGSSFLGMELTITKDWIKLSQSRYVHMMVEKFGMVGSNSVSTPMHDSKYLLDNSLIENEKLESTTNYQRLVGSLLYAATMTRPDILFAVNLLSRFNANPRSRHMTAARRVLKYLKGSTNRGLVYYPSEQISITAFSDADLAGDPSDRVSISGGLIFLSQGLVTLYSRKYAAGANKDEKEVVVYKGGGRVFPV